MGYIWDSYNLFALKSFCIAHAACDVYIYICHFHTRTEKHGYYSILSQNN